MAVPNSTFSDSFVATAIDRWVSDTLYDQVFEKTPTLAWLKQHQKPEPNGLKINVPLQYAQSTVAGAFAKGATATLADREIATVAQYDWYTYWDSIAVYPQDLMKCAGDSQKVNLLEAKMKNVQDSLRDAINADLWATSQGTNKFIPLPVIVDTTTDVGGIDVSANSFWEATVETTSESISTSRMANTYNTCSNGKAGGTPGLIVATQTLFEAYEELVLPYFRLTNDLSMGKLGFEALKFKGAEVVWDENCVSGNLFFLNSENVSLVPHTDCASKFLIWEGKPADQIANPRIVWCMFALVTNRRASLGKQTGKTA